MINSLFHPSISWMELVVRAVVVYLSVLILLRVAGKRQLGQMSPTEFVALLLISNAVQNAMNGGDNSLAGGLVLAITLIALTTLISLGTYRSVRFRRIFEGTPTLIVHRSKPIPAALAKEHMTLSELRTLLRKQGFEDLSDVHSAVIESDGSLSVIHRKEAQTHPH